MIITENGGGRRDTLEDDGSIHDSYRIEHLRRMIEEMTTGIEEGALLFGYCPWSAVDLVSTREGISNDMALFMSIEMKMMKKQKQLI